MIGVYKITSPTKKVYIGQSIDIEKRFRVYKNVCERTKQQTALYRSFIKHGVDNHNFEILEECLESELNDKERYYQDLYSAVGKNGLNLRLTKSKDRSGKMSEETKLKISCSRRKITDSAYVEKQRKAKVGNIENNKRLLELNKKKSIKVKCFDRYTCELIGVYDSIRHASRETKVSQKSIKLSASGHKYKYSKGKYFEYV